MKLQCVTTMISHQASRAMRLQSLRDCRCLPPAERGEPWITNSRIPPGLRIDAVEFGLPVMDQNHPGRRSPSASPTVLVVALPAPYLTLSQCEGRVAVLPGQ